VAIKRIHLTDADLRNVRVERSFGPLAEAALSLRRLLATGPPAVSDGREDTMGLTGWRDQVRTRLRPSDCALAALVPLGLDVITATGRAASIDEAVERVAALPADQIGAELAYSAQGPFPPPVWAAPLADRTADARRRLAMALHRYHDVAIGPYWPAIATLLDREHARATRLAGEEGLDAFLSSLHPSISWDAPTLTIDIGVEPKSRDWHLDGTGIVVIPSLFCPPGYPMCWQFDASSPPVLQYPVAPGADELCDVFQRRDRSGGPSPLAALLGRTRAAVLEAIADSACTTRELARRTHASPPSASQHASVLRDAGLVTTRRAGQAVLHTVTALGDALLER
jgi:hypothetical protein